MDDRDMARKLLHEIDTVDGDWEEYDCEAIPIVIKYFEAARAEALREAAEKGWDWIKKNCENELLIGDSFVNAIRSDKQEGQ